MFSGLTNLEDDDNRSGATSYF